MINKKIIFLGSSVTWGDEGWSMCDFIAEDERYDVTKWAVSGTTLSAEYENSYVERFDAHRDSEPHCDAFICQLSTNDAGKGITLGEIAEGFDKSDFNTHTVIGSIEYIIASAREKWGCPIMFYTGTYFESKPYAQMVGAILKIAEKWQIGVIDLWNDEEMRAVSAKDYARYMKDGVHPSKAGYREWWGPKFIAAIENVVASDWCGAGGERRTALTGASTNYKLIACDIDGTLLGSAMKLSSENRDAIRALRKKGIEFVPATGRSLSEIGEVLDVDDIRYIIYSNGAAILDRYTCSTTFIALSESQTAFVLDISKHFPCYIIEHCDGKTCVGEKGEAVYSKYNVSLPVRKLLDDFAECVDDFPRRMYTMKNMENINIFFANEADMRVCKSLISKSGDLLCVEGWKCNLEIFSSKAGKGNALKMLSDRLSVNICDTVCVGDSENDLPIISVAGLGLCVANGCEELKAAADGIICSNDEHVADYILKHYFL